MTAGYPTSAERIAGRLRGRVVAATLTPFDDRGRVVHEAVEGYVSALARDGVGGLAVGAHTGRGSRLAPDDLVRLVATSAATSVPVVAGLGLPATADATDDPAESLLPLGERLVDAGAATLLVVPPSGADRATVVRTHERLGAELGVPLIAFVLYDRASGGRYDEATVLELAAQPWVVGVKLALLDDAVTCQDLTSAIRAHAPHVLVISGEDRMFGPSLLWGADSALVGVAAAFPSWTVRVVDAWARADYSSFVTAARWLDRFAALTFREPIEGYVQRMAWAAARQGILAEKLVVDPYAPAMDPDERARLNRGLSRLLAEAPTTLS